MTNVTNKAAGTNNTETQAILASCDADSEGFALRELRELAPEMQKPVWLTDGLVLLKPNMSFDDFAALVAARPPIFVRHIAPVQRTIPLTASESDIPLLAAAALELAGLLDPALSFAVQSRVLGDGPLPYRKFTLNSTISEQLQAATGAATETRSPQQVVSLLCTADTGYLGISRTEQNLSAWPGGEHRFKAEEEQISRAEFKLLEAFSVFEMTLPEHGNALDLGSAPGGWTRVLRAKGLRVTAVDPADIDVRFRRDLSVTHVRERIETFLPKIKTRYTVLVNDMRMDALDSVEIMLKARDVILPGAPAIVTLKLPLAVKSQDDALATVRLCTDRLSRAYDLIGVRQLYHNRSEVTVALTASV